MVQVKGSDRISKPTRSPTDTSRVRRSAGVSLFLVVTAYWAFMLEDLFSYEDLFFFYVAWGLSAFSVVITGYLLGRYTDARWLGWIPGVAMTAVGFWMADGPGGDESGSSQIFFGPLIAVFGWGLYFFPLMALGVWLRHLGERRSTRASPSSPPATGSGSATV